MAGPPRPPDEDPPPEAPGERGQEPGTGSIAAEAGRAAEEERLRTLAVRLLRKRGSLQSLGHGEIRMDEAAIADDLRLALERPGGPAGRASPGDAERIAAAVSSHVIGGLQDSARPLRPLEFRSLQLIVETLGRPALAIDSNGVEQPLDVAGNERWVVHLSLRGQAVRQASRAVGAVFRQSSIGPLLLGTAWRTRNGCLVTNRHVARRLAEDPGRRPAEWALWTGGEAWIDFSYFGAPSRQRGRLTRIVHAASDQWLDMAILTSEPSGAAAGAGDGVDIDWTRPVVAGQEIYVVGHPDSNIDQPDLVSIFRTADGRKRLSPGEVDRLRPEGRIFEHDCSTLSGNSGSCAIDFATGAVVGLHFGGVGPDETSALGRANVCIAFAALKDHPSTAALRSEGGS